MSCLACVSLLVWLLLVLLFVWSVLVCVFSFLFIVFFFFFFGAFFSFWFFFFFFFSSRRRHTRCLSDWSSDVCSSDLRSGAKPAEGSGGTGRTTGDGSMARGGRGRRWRPGWLRLEVVILPLLQIGRASCRERV